MNEEHRIGERVLAAKRNTEEADRLIREYMPFIKAETAKFINRPPAEGRDDELSIAMMAFYEAICGYSRGRGTFLKYAAMLIRSRLIDYQRRERRHRELVSLNAQTGEEETALEDSLSDDRDHSEELALRDATRAEIEELTCQMQKFGVKLSDVAENCPRQQRTLEACRRALQYAREHPELLEELLKSGRLPVTRLAAGSGVERKTLERHRKYMVALLLIYTNGFEIIRGHLKQVMKGGAG